MRAMLLEKPKSILRLTSLPVPEPSKNQILIRVLTCGVCRTDLHAGSSNEAPPAPLDAAIIFAPVG